MKRIVRTIVVSILCCLPVWLQAQHIQKRVVEHPGFITTNTAEIEIKKIILTDEQTQVDAVIYGKPGEIAVISPDTYLTTEKNSFRLREAENISIGGTTEPERIPESGKLNVTFSFAPIPRGVHEVDFVEEETGWTIYGVQLSRQEPYVYVPNFLKSQPENTIPELPEPGLSAGKAVVNGYLLGYDTRMGVDMLLTYTDKLFPNTWKNNVTVRQDGSFHAEIDMLQPDTVHLSVNKAILPIFLVPEEEVTIYVSLPRLSMAASSLLEDKYRRKQKAWFDGAAEIINTELATTGTSHALKSYRLAEKDLTQNDAVKSAIRKDKEAVRPLCERLLKNPILTSADRKVLKDLTFEDIRRYVEQKSETLLLEAARSESSHEAVIATLDDKIAGSDILPQLIAPHRGRAILIDFWATWCGPCRKSIRAMKPLRQKLASKDIVYIYLTGPSSPENIWKETLKEMTGVHFRLTETQWKDVCSAYGITGIPAYLIISHDGKLKSKHIGFPGADILEKELLRASEE